MAIELVVPKLGESISEAVIGKWLKKVGEATAVDEPVVDLETDKVSLALPAPGAGVLVEQRFAVGATVRVGDVIGTIAEGKAASPPASVSVPAPAPAPAPAPGISTAHEIRPHASPAMRKAMREGVVPAPQTPTPTPTSTPTKTSTTGAGEREEVVPMSPLRKRIAERLVAAQHSAAILTTFNEVDMTNVMGLRARFQEQFTAKHGIKLGFMSFFAKACVEALKEFPGLNAEVRGNDIVYKKHYDLGIAVGSGKGLVVPVVRDVDGMSFAEVEKGIARMAGRAKEGKLTIEELSGATFSITNGGIYGSMMSTPLLNPPQTGILGMHNIIKRPVAVGDEVALRPMMYLALSYDHRVADGREAVQFLIGVKERIEAPERLMFEL